ncbi:hypothetical protein A2U01_0071710, partial [Trifolium medium]|nr:hypothetical protein [Trifolium medium]
MMQKIRKQSSAPVPCARRSRGYAMRNEKTELVFSCRGLRPAWLVLRQAK